MKKTMKLIPAIAMLLVSAVLVSTATFAWFSMGNTVTANGMQVKARAESGIVIKNVTGTNSTAWGSTATAQHTDAVELYPTSTSDVTTWYHAVSRYYDNADPNQTAEGAYSTVETLTGRQDTFTNEYFACYQFNIKSATNTPLTTASIDVNSVTVTLPQTQQSENLNRSLRVGVVLVNQNNSMGTLTGIYAPVEPTGGQTSITPTYQYTVNHTTNVTAVTGASKTSANFTSIPTADDALRAYVYVWFEGEDANCKSSNVVATLDNMTVQIVFGYTAPTTP